MAVTVRVTGVDFSTATLVTLRLSSVDLATIQQIQAWDGSQWVTVPADPTRAEGSSEGTGVASGVAHFPGSSDVYGTSEGTGVAGGMPTASGSLAITGHGVLSEAGGEGGTGIGRGSLAIGGRSTLRVTGTPINGTPGHGSITVTPQPGNWPPRMLIDLAGFLGATAIVTRNDPSGPVPVRSGNPVTLSSGGAVLYDVEAKFNQSVTYTVTAGNIKVTSDPVMLQVDQSWLTHLGIPSLSMPVTVAEGGIATRTRTTNVGVFQPIGRPTPVTRTDGVRHAPAYNLTVYTHGMDEERQLLELLADASTVLFQLANPGRARSRYEYIAVGDVTEDDLTEGYQDEPYIAWTLPCTVTDAPSGLLQSQRTWADVLAEFSTWQDVTDTYATWRDVITDNRIGT